MALGRKIFTSTLFSGFCLECKFFNTFKMIILYIIYGPFVRRINEGNSGRPYTFLPDSMKQIKCI